MITEFGNLQSFNDGQAKSVSVVAAEDASGGMETINFDINGTVIPVQANIPSNGIQLVKVTHTVSSNGGKVPVQVSAAGSPKTLTQLLDLDRIPGDPGTGS
ncbi:hypothetical protein SBA3_4290009 [Candidatus Sulfopaludibacter sp. SbA3]|nr:hypothetical protein SBA3_4290009 [Candidatus Sulfopaludibacter sp. SbA3]